MQAAYLDSLDVVLGVPRHTASKVPESATEEVVERNCHRGQLLSTTTLRHSFGGRPLDLTPSGQTACEAVLASGLQRSVLMVNAVLGVQNLRAMVRLGKCWGGSSGKSMYQFEASAVLVQYRSTIVSVMYQQWSISAVQFKPRRSAVPVQCQFGASTLPGSVQI